MAWLHQILTNEVRQVRRAFRADKRNWQRERPGITVDSQHEVRAIDLADSLPTPGTEALVNEQSVRIRAAMQRLSDDHRTVIRLRNWQRLSFSEIAQQMNRSENAVTKLWFRALVRLEEELENNDHEP